MRWHNDSELYRTLIGHHRYVDEATERAWLQKRIKARDGSLSLAICLIEGEQHIGNIYLNELDRVVRMAELGIFIGEPTERGKRYGTEAVSLLVTHAFAVMDLQRVYLRVLADNEAAIRAYQSCGFEVEGRLRRHSSKEGTFKDVLVMGLCKPSAAASSTGGGSTMTHRPSLFATSLVLLRGPLVSATGPGW